MSEPKRYSAFSDGRHFHMKETQKGGWVHYEDYARLKDEVERLRAFSTRTIIPNEELQAQVERLTKTGDDMAVWITIIGNSLTCWQIEEWLRAKKGLPSEKEQREKQIKAAAKDGKGVQS